MNGNERELWELVEIGGDKRVVLMLVREAGRVAIFVMWFVWGVVSIVPAPLSFWKNGLRVSVRCYVARGFGVGVVSGSRCNCSWGGGHSERSEEFHSLFRPLSSRLCARLCPTAMLARHLFRNLAFCALIAHYRAWGRFAVGSPLPKTKSHPQWMARLFPGWLGRRPTTPTFASAMRRQAGRRHRRREGRRWRAREWGGQRRSAPALCCHPPMTT
jgi:hypothetical protein